MLSLLQFLWNCFRRMLNHLQRAEHASVQYFMIFNQDVYFSHDQSIHHPHNGNILNHDHSFHSSLNNGNWTLNTVTNRSNENASTVITNGDSAGGFDESADEPKWQEQGFQALRVITFELG
ncbi:hypothetical protein CPC08DRAFT_731214 [Agrocybe pediades]|nr:hypothetical protein CPC08DRAFT_731214 [Agrocybe pediades]